MWEVFRAKREGVRYKGKKAQWCITGWDGRRETTTGVAGISMKSWRDVAGESPGQTVDTRESQRFGQEVLWPDLHFPHIPGR